MMTADNLEILRYEAVERFKAQHPSDAWRRFFDYLWENRNEPASGPFIAEKLLPWERKKEARDNKVNQWAARLNEALQKYDALQHSLPEYFIKIELKSRPYWLKLDLAPGKESAAQTYLYRELPYRPWSPFVWRVNKGEPDRIALQVWLPPQRQALIHVEFDPVGLWKPPVGFSAYYNTYRPSVEQACKERDPKGHNEHVFGVKNVAVYGSGRMRVSVHRADYYDYHATNLAIEKKIELDNKKTVTVGEWLQAKWRDGFLEDFHLGSNTLAVNVLLLSKKAESALIVRQHKTHPFYKLKWVASVSGGVRFRGEADGKDLLYRKPIPRDTAFNQAKEETGIEINRESVRWIAFGAGLKMGSPCLLGEVETNLSESEINTWFERRQGQMETDQRHFVKMEPREVMKVLNDKKNFPHRTFFRLALALALIRRGMAETV